MGWSGWSGGTDEPETMVVVVVVVSSTATVVDGTAGMVEVTCINGFRLASRSTRRAGRIRVIGLATTIPMSVNDPPQPDPVATR